MTKERELLKATAHIRGLNSYQIDFAGSELERYLKEVESFLISSDLLKNNPFSLNEVLSLQPKKVTLEF